MTVTVREALRSKAFNGCSLIAGEAGLDRPISCIDEMEVPNILPWLKKDELLITTGYAVKDDEGALLGIIQGLYDAGSSGIALKTRFIGNIPPSITELADRLEIPIIVIPPELPFIDIIHPLMKQIVDEQNMKLEFTEQMNERFLNLQIEGGSFDSICSMLGSLIQCDVLITYRNFEVISSYQASQGSMSGWIEDNGTGGVFLKDFLKDPQFCQGGSLVRLEDGGEMMACMINVKGKCRGYMYVMGRSGQLTEMMQIAVRQASVYAALEFSGKGLAEEREFHQDTGFFLDLINENTLSEDEAQKRARGHGWAVLPCRMTISDIDDFESFAEGKSEQEIQNIKDDILEEYKSVIKKKFHVFFVTNLSDRFYCLFPQSADKFQITDLIGEICIRLKKKFMLTMTTGASNMIEQFSRFAEAHEEGKTAVEIGKKERSGRSVFFIDDLALESVFLEMGRQEYFRNFSSSLLKPLEEYDRGHESRLMETLEMLTEKAGARKETADALFLHRNTLLYRLSQIEEITGFNLNDHEVILKLTIAFKIRRFVF